LKTLPMAACWLARSTATHRVDEERAFRGSVDGQSGAVRACGRALTRHWRRPRLGTHESPARHAARRRPASSAAPRRRPRRWCRSAQPAYNRAEHACALVPAERPPTHVAVPRQAVRGGALVEHGAGFRGTEFGAVVIAADKVVGRECAGGRHGEQLRLLLLPPLRAGRTRAGVRSREREEARTDRHVRHVTRVRPRVAGLRAERSGSVGSTAARCCRALTRGCDQPARRPSPR
jgi:hypothetical protein